VAACLTTWQSEGPLSLSFSLPLALSFFLSFLITLALALPLQPSIVSLSKHGTTDPTRSSSRSSRPLLPCDDFRNLGLLYNANESKGERNRLDSRGSHANMLVTLLQLNFYTNVEVGPVAHGREGDKGSEPTPYSRSERVWTSLVQTTLSSKVSSWVFEASAARMAVLCTTHTVSRM
jgi:hypothetical protein